MKLSTVKGKLLVGAIVLAILSSAGLAFANTDAGEALKDWYNGKFGESVDAASDEATEYGENVYADLLEEYSVIKADAADAIDATRESETENAEGKIEAAKNERIDSLEDERAEILAGMQQEFAGVHQEGWLKIQQLANEAADAAREDLTAYTNEQGDAALNQLGSDLTAAEEEAVEELEDAVENAKAEITAKLDEHEELLVNNWTKDIDYAADDLRDTVDEIQENLVTEQQELITETAEKLTEDAIDSLDDVVDGI